MRDIQMKIFFLFSILFTANSFSQTNSFEFSFDSKSSSSIENISSSNISLSSSSVQRTCYFTNPIDGRKYKVVVIDSITWMAENLNYITASGSKCYDDKAANCQKYGRLYDLKTAQNVCPMGWHLATADEFKKLFLYKGAEGDWEKGNIGKRLKAKNGWNNFEGKFGNGTDDFGFSSLPGGMYNPIEKKFSDIGDISYLWTSTKFSSDSTWRMILDNANEKTNIGLSPITNKDMISVRCVKDNLYLAKIECQENVNKLSKEPTKLNEFYFSNSKSSSSSEYNMIKISNSNSNSFNDPRDGKIYRTALISGYTWMAENLNYNTSDSKCYDNDTNNCQKYGRLYNSQVAQNICPEGWHLATLDEFEKIYLYKYLEGDWKKGNIGKRFKAKNGWNDFEGKSGNGTDDFNFSLLPAGAYSLIDGKEFTDIGTGGYLWTSTKYNSDSTWRIFFDVINDDFNIYLDSRPNKNLYSVRCVKDYSLVILGEKEQLEYKKSTKEFSLEIEKLKAQDLAAAAKERNKQINQQVEDLIVEITTLLKANKLEECFNKCEKTSFNFNALHSNTQKSNVLKLNGIHKFREPDLFTEFINDDNKEKVTNLCGKQLIDKIKKLPKKNIKSSDFAQIYFSGYEEVSGYIFQNDGKMILMSDIAFGTTIMVQYAGHLGRCMLSPSSRIPFSANVKYLGEKVYTTITGARQSVPNYQLLWCDDW